MATKYVAQFVQHYTPYIKGDVLVMDEKKFNDLKAKGIVILREKRQDAEPEKPKDALTGKNLKGEEYKKGKVDVVIPTKKITPALKKKSRKSKSAKK